MGRNLKMSIKKIISGGQTGVDQGALEFALENNIPCGGFCPNGRKCETGRIADHFPLTETESRKYSVRTRLNIEHSDGTLILVNNGKMGKGTSLTLDLCNFLGKTFLILDMGLDIELLQNNFRGWINLHGIQILNVAGNRESQNPGIQSQTFQLLQQLFLATKG